MRDFYVFSSLLLCLLSIIALALAAFGPMDFSRLEYFVFSALLGNGFIVGVLVKLGVF